MWVKICGLTNESDAQAALEAGADALGFIFARSSPRYVPHHSPEWQAWVERLGEHARFRAERGMTETADSHTPRHSERSEKSPRLVLYQSEFQVPYNQGQDAPVFLPSPLVPLPRAGEGPEVRAEMPHPSPRLVLVLTAPDELPPNWRLFHAVQWVVPNRLMPGAAALCWLPDLPLWAAFRFPPEVSAEDALRTLEAWSPYVERFVLDTYHPQQLGGTGAVQDWRRAAAICQQAPKPTILAGGLNVANVAEAIRTVQPAGVDVSSGVESSAGRKDHAQVGAFIQNAKSALEGRLE